MNRLFDWTQIQIMSAQIKNMFVSNLFAENNAVLSFVLEATILFGYQWCSINSTAIFRIR